MDKYRKQLITAIITAVLILGLLFSGQMIYQRYYIDQPLLKMYKTIKAVEDVQVEAGDKDQGDRILISVDPQTNLKQVYQLVNEQTRKVYGKKQFKIQLNDKPNAILENTLVDIEPYLYQGLATGQLVDMVAGIKAKSVQAGIDVRVYMDSQRVYLVLRKGNKYLQEIIPRQEPIETPVSGGAKL